MTGLMAAFGLHSVLASAQTSSAGREDCPAAGLSDADTVEKPSPGSKSGHSVNIQIGTHKLHIPEGYASSFMGYAGYVQLHAMLPCLTPETEQNSPEFHTNTPGAILVATLSAWKGTELEGQAVLDVYHEHTAMMRRSKPGNSDFYPAEKQIPGTTFTFFKDEMLSFDIFASKRPESILILSCGIKDNFLRYPTCRIRERIWGDVALDYWYARSFIDSDVENANVVEGRLRSLLDSFVRQK